MDGPRADMSTEPHWLDKPCTCAIELFVVSQTWQTLQIACFAIELPSSKIKFACFSKIRNH